MSTDGSRGREHERRRWRGERDRRHLELVRESWIAELAELVVLPTAKPPDLPAPTNRLDRSDDDGPPGPKPIGGRVSEQRAVARTSPQVVVRASIAVTAHARPGASSSEAGRLLRETRSALAIVRCQYHRALARAGDDYPGARAYWYAEARRLVQVAVGLSRNVTRLTRATVVNATNDLAAPSSSSGALRFAEHRVERRLIDPLDAH